MTKRLVALAAFGVLTAGASMNTSAGEVIRVADVPRERYEQLHKMGDFWSVDRETGEVIMYVNERRRAEIEALGYDTRLDEERMRSLEYARSIDAEAWRRAGRDGIPGFECYRTVDETHADLSAMAAERPDLARWETIGETWLEENGQPGGDELQVLVLGNQNSPHEQPPFVLMAAQHARELTTAETATRFAEWLFDNYDTDPTARWLLDHREVHIIAQQNPDGRREVEGGEELWRKNSNLDHTDICGTTVDPFGSSGPGVDLNRNSDFFFGGPSTSDYECDQTYNGPAEASEPETQAIQIYMDQVFERHRIGSPGDIPDEPVPEDADGLFISLHSYGELVLFPWEGSGSGSANNAPNHDQLAWLGRKFGYFTGYDVGRDILYSAGGTTVDYAHGAFGVAAYTYEIGTTFQQGCDTFETAIIDDQIDSLIYAAKVAARPYQAPSGPDIIETEVSYDIPSRQFRISGVADDSRFDRGNVSEAPADDPIASPVEIRASIGVPPDQAASPIVVTLSDGGSSTPFEFDLEASPGMNLPALLFLQATDSEGDVGVPEAVWLPVQRVFGDGFEAAP